MWFQNATGLEQSLARSLLGRLGFEQDDQLRPVSVLSGGERVRLEIALALNVAAPPQMLLLDEPTNHLDLESRRILQSFVEGFEGGLVVVSHDEAFVSSLDFDAILDLDAFY
jgi:ATPase subunit of ABC transporter with duplicated ATPase domains